MHVIKSNLFQSITNTEGKLFQDCCMLTSLHQYFQVHRILFQSNKSLCIDDSSFFALNPSVQAPGANEVMAMLIVLNSWEGSVAFIFHHFVDIWFLWKKIKWRIINFEAKGKIISVCGQVAPLLNQ